MDERASKRGHPAIECGDDMDVIEEYGSPSLPPPLPPSLHCVRQRTDPGGVQTDNRLNDNSRSVYDEVDRCQPTEFLMTVA